MCTYGIIVYSLHHGVPIVYHCVPTVSLCTYCIMVYSLYHGVPIVSLHHGVRIVYHYYVPVSTQTEITEISVISVCVLTGT